MSRTWRRPTSPRSTGRRCRARSISAPAWKPRSTTSSRAWPARRASPGRPATGRPGRASSAAAAWIPPAPRTSSAGGPPSRWMTGWLERSNSSRRRPDDDRRGAPRHPGLSRLQGRPLVRGNPDHLPGVPQGLSHPGRHSGDADLRGGALGADQVTAVILAGGQGTRLRPLTYDRPKPIVPLLNIPFLAYQLALLARHGVRDAVLSCSYMVDAVRATMGDGAACGVRLSYAVEDEPLGTAGGVRHAVDV